MPDLSGARVAVLATDYFEESELTEPVRAFRDAGATVDVIAPHNGKLQAMQHEKKSIQVPVDHVLDDARPEDYDGLILPGGALNADALRTNEQAQAFARSFDERGKPMAVICHAPWLLVSAGLVAGRTLTSYPSIRDDIANAGATWVDEEVTVDRNWVTSRRPDDLPAFNREAIGMVQHARAGAPA